MGLHFDYISLNLPHLRLYSSESKDSSVYFIFIICNEGAVEFEEEKISLASVTGPPSDISDRSANSFGASANDQQRKLDGDGISVKSGSESLQSGGVGPLVSISGSVGTTGALLSISPSSAVISNDTVAVESMLNLRGSLLTTSSSSDMKGNANVQ